MIGSRTSISSLLIKLQTVDLGRGLCWFHGLDPLRDFASERLGFTRHHLLLSPPAGRLRRERGVP